MKKITPFKSLSFLIAFLSVVSFGFGQSIFDNPITGTNPGLTNPYVAGRSFDANITVDGIRRGSGAIGRAGDDRYNARGWNTTSIDNTAYFEFTLTPNPSFVIDFVSFVYNGAASGTGPTNFAFRSSLDGFTTDIGAPTASGLTIDLSSGAYQNITSAITFRFYAWGASSIVGTFSIDDFTFNGIVSALPTCASSITWDGVSGWSNGTGPGTLLDMEVTLLSSYDTATNGGSFGACSLIVANGATLNIADNDYIEVENDLTVNSGGIITVQPYGAFIQNNDSGTAINNGTIQVSKNTAPLNNWYEYTYWSSPVSNTIIDVALSDSDYDRRFIFNASQFNDEFAETGNNNAAILGQDDIDDDNNDWQQVNGATVMQPGVGYAATHSEIAYVFPGVGYRYTFEGGTFNTGFISVPVDRNDVTTADMNWNLIGNPYPSAIDIDAFMTQNMYDVATNPSGTLEGAIYFWSQNTDYSASANGNEGLNFDTTDYATHNGTGGTMGGDGLTPNGFIPSGQGFFVSFSDDYPTNSGTVVFNNAMRSLSLSPDNSQFFKSSNSKKGSTSLANKLWINLTSDNGVFNQILLGYVNGATNDDDGAYYDARKIVAPKAYAALYSTIENTDKKFAIQGKAISSLNEDEIINLGFSTNIDVATLYTLSIAQLQGDFLTNNTVYLKDKVLNKIHDLSASDYTFTSEVGEFNSRFEVVFNANALSVEGPVLDSKALRIVQLDNDRVQFNVSENLSIKTVTIFDLLGRQLYNLKGNSPSETYNLSNLNDAIYVAKVELSNGAVITKKAVKK